MSMSASAVLRLHAEIVQPHRRPDPGDILWGRSSSTLSPIRFDHRVTVRQRNRPDR